MWGAHVDLVLEAFQARRELEANPALAPFAVLGNYILGDKGDRHGPANELVLFRTGLRRDEREVRRTIGGSDGYEATIGLNAGVKNQLEAELIEVKAQALLQIADENRNRLEAQVRILAIQANSGALCPLRGRIAHGRDYKVESIKLTLAAEALPSRGAASCATTNAGAQQLSLRTSRGPRERGGHGRGAGRRH